MSSSIAAKALALLTPPLRLLLGDPRVSGAILLAVLYDPERLRKFLSADVYSIITSPRFIQSLKVLVGLGVSQRVNSKLSEWVLNNWKGNMKFVKSQEVVLISGGCSGIGLLMAQEFAKMGSKVVIMDLNPPKYPLPSNVRFYQCDVTSSSQIKSVAAEMRTAVGEPTVLINNAGIGSGETILAKTEDLIRKTFEVNTLAHFWMVREFVPDMIKKNRGHVVTIASMASFLVHGGNVDYSCSKASAHVFHEGLASELKSRYKAPNVKTTSVHPAWVRTPLTERLIAKPGFNDPVLEPEVVVSAVVKQVVSGKSGQLIIPQSLLHVTGVRSWPLWLQETVRNKLAYTLEDPDADGTVL